jgi:phage terminase large subunit-like protein
MRAEISLIEPQQIIFNSPARFKVCAAGRRLGKTTLAAIMCITEGLKTENAYGDPLGSDAEVVYFGVDREQAKRNVWNILKQIAKDAGVFVKAHENNAVLTISNGVNECRIRLLGMDNPDSARGMKLRFAVLDEYADMPEEAWAEIIRPALMDSRGSALFIGTPKGKNHFFELFSKVKLGLEGDDWEAFEFGSKANTTIHEDELEKMAEEYSRGSPELYAQEIEGKFIAKGGALFHEDDFIIAKENNMVGSTFITVDLAGFQRASGKRNAEMKKLDETVICVAKAYTTTDKNGKEDVGWFVEEMYHGQWDVEETARRIVDAYVKHRPQALGIEKGALYNAVTPYMETYQRQRRAWFEAVPLTHGNQKKYDRIQWALQGRLKRGLITLKKADWNVHLIEQAVDFPSRLSHDDMVDALAYMDQLADYIEFDWGSQQQWTPFDITSGY